MPGTITVKPLQAKLENKEGIFGTFDPYCAAIIGNHIVESQPCHDGGKNPIWKEALTIERKAEPYCYIEVKDKALLKNQILGICAIDLDELSAAKSSQKWYELYCDKKPVGEILIETSVSPPDIDTQDLMSGDIVGEEEVMSKEIEAEEKKILENYPENLMPKRKESLTFSGAQLSSQFGQTYKAEALYQTPTQNQYSTMHSDVYTPEAPTLGAQFSFAPSPSSVEFSKIDINALDRDLTEMQRRVDEVLRKSKAFEAERTSKGYGSIASPSSRLMTTESLAKEGIPHAPPSTGVSASGRKLHIFGEIPKYEEVESLMPMETEHMETEHRQYYGCGWLTRSAERPPRRIPRSPAHEKIHDITMKFLDGVATLKEATRERFGHKEENLEQQGQQGPPGPQISTTERVRARIFDGIENFKTISKQKLTYSEKKRAPRIGDSDDEEEEKGHKEPGALKMKMYEKVENLTHASITKLTAFEDKLKAKHATIERGVGTEGGPAEVHHPPSTFEIVKEKIIDFKERQREKLVGRLRGDMVDEAIQTSVIIEPSTMEKIKGKVMEKVDQVKEKFTHSGSQEVEDEEEGYKGSRTAKHKPSRVEEVKDKIVEGVQQIKHTITGSDNKKVEVEEEQAVTVGPIIKEGIKQIGKEVVKQKIDNITGKAKKKENNNKPPKTVEKAVSVSVGPEGDMYHERHHHKASLKEKFKHGVSQLKDILAELESAIEEKREESHMRRSERHSHHEEDSHVIEELKYKFTNLMEELQNMKHDNRTRFDVEPVHTAEEEQVSKMETIKEKFWEGVEQMKGMVKGKEEDQAVVVGHTQQSTFGNIKEKVVEGVEELKHKSREVVTHFQPAKDLKPDNLEEGYEIVEEKRLGGYGDIQNYQYERIEPNQYLSGYQYENIAKPEERFEQPYHPTASEIISEKVEGKEMGLSKQIASEYKDKVHLLGSFHCDNNITSNQALLQSQQPPLTETMRENIINQYISTDSQANQFKEPSTYNYTYTGDNFSTETFQPPIESVPFTDTKEDFAEALQPLVDKTEKPKSSQPEITLEGEHEALEQHHSLIETIKETVTSKVEKLVEGHKESQAQKEPEIQKDLAFLETLQPSEISQSMQSVPSSDTRENFAEALQPLVEKTEKPQSNLPESVPQGEPLEHHHSLIDTIKETVTSKVEKLVEGHKESQAQKEPEIQKDLAFLETLQPSEISQSMQSVPSSDTRENFAEALQPLVEKTQGIKESPTQKELELQEDNAFSDDKGNFAEALQPLVEKTEKSQPNLTESAPQGEPLEHHHSLIDTIKDKVSAGVEKIVSKLPGHSAGHSFSEDMPVVSKVSGDENHVGSVLPENIEEKIYQIPITGTDLLSSSPKGESFEDFKKRYAGETEISGQRQDENLLNLKENYAFTENQDFGRQYENIDSKVTGSYQGAYNRDILGNLDTNLLGNEGNQESEADKSMSFKEALSMYGDAFSTSNVENADPNKFI